MHPYIHAKKNPNKPALIMASSGEITTYKELDERLSQTQFLAGNDYTIADIATFPWIARHERHDIGLKKFSYLTRWYEEISDREAVKKGYDLLNKGDQIPKVY